MENTNPVSNIPNSVRKPNKFLQWALTISIVIVLNMFFNYALSLIYKAPEYDQFIKPAQIIENIDTKEKCLSIGGQWTENINYNEDMKSSPKQIGWCDPEYTNRNNYESARKIYERNVFITLIVLGVVTLAISFYVGLALLATAFSWGGVLSIVIASIRYWSIADNLLKVIILAIALGVLIYLAVKKFNK
jgi:hypothetical protein